MQRKDREQLRNPVFYLVLIALLIAGMGTQSHAQRREIPAVIKAGNAAEKLPIDLTGLRAEGEPARMFYQVLGEDLTRSGWFVLAERGGGTAVVSGSASAQGGRLQVAFDVTRAVDRKRYVSPRFNGGIADARRFAHQAADDIVSAVKGIPGIAGTRIAMVGTVNGKKDIYLCDSDGGNITRWTQDGAVCISPNWSPDGRKVIFTSFRAGFPDVYTMDLHNRQLLKVAGYPGLNAGADISPDGKEVALTLSKDGNPEIYVLDLRSKRLTRLTKSRTAEASPTWSPDGRKIAFVSDRTGAPQVYVMDRRGGRQRRVTLQGRENVAPDWGASGKIAYSSRQGARYRICVIDPESRRSSILSDGDADHEDPSWAPDGRHIICSRTAGYRSDLYVLDVLGDPPIRLTRQAGDWYSPAWSPR